MAEGVFVTGMDRSGTSATTGLISLFGLKPPVEADLITAADTNPTGFWESRSLAALNVRLLKAAGSDERFPAALEPGWEAEPGLDPLRDEARRAFGRAFPASPWVWKDPLLCLAFPFWRSTLGPGVVVLVVRNPLEIAVSAQRAWGREKIYGLALWERYLRQALAQFAGQPVLVTSYAAVLGGPRTWAARTHAVLGDAGIAVLPYRDEEVDAAVERDLRHSAFSLEDVRADRDVSRAQRELYETLTALDGMHSAFASPDLPDETPTTDALLTERRRAFTIKDRLEQQLAEQRGSGWQSRLRRLAGIGGATR